jgi:hypothetical protein
LRRCRPPRLGHDGVFAELGGAQRTRPEVLALPADSLNAPDGRLSRVLSRRSSVSADQAGRAGARKPLSVVRRIEGSNPSPSALHAESDAANGIAGLRGVRPCSGGDGTEGHRDPLRFPRAGARPARAGPEKRVSGVLGGLDSAGVELPFLWQGESGGVSVLWLLCGAADRAACCFGAGGAEGCVGVVL